MINYLSCSIADYFYLNKIIEEHEKDIYIYGLRLMISTIVSILSIIIISFITNGSYINDDICKILAKYNVRVKITLDGPNEDINDSLRGKGSFTKITNTLKIINENNMSDHVILRCNLHFDNYKYINDIIKLAKSYGIKEINFGLLVNSGRTRKINLLGFSNYQEIKEIRDQINEYNNQNFKINFSNNVIFICPLLVPNAHTMIKIDSTGNIFPCQSLYNPEYAIGHIYDKSVSINNINDKLNKFSTHIKERHKKMSECKLCAYKGICRGGCIADSILLTGGEIGW